MIKDNQKTFNKLHTVLDALMIIAAYATAWYFVIVRWRSSGVGVLPAGIYFSVLWGIVPFYLILYGAFRLYTPKRTQGRRQEFANICKANILGLMCITFLFFAVRNLHEYFGYFSAKMIVAFFFINIVYETVERNFIRFILSRIRAKGFNQKHILLVGYSSTAEQFIKNIKRNPGWGYHIYGILDDTKEKGYSYRDTRVIGKISQLPSILEENTLDEIAITLSLSEYKSLASIVHICEKSGVHTKFVPDYEDILPTIPLLEDMDGLPVINIRAVPLMRPYNAAMKRIMDIIGALVAIILFSPIMLVVAILVKTTSPGPIIFCQERVGRHNRPFKMYKFRSMVEQKPEDEEKGWTKPGDPRVTKVGSFIRKTSIDETPQFFNVLKGDMSLVGPRPERTQFVEKFKETIPRYMVKHQVRPGITGWAQVCGLRGDTSIEERIKHDLYYIENWTLGFDIKILFLTVFKGFVNKNAY